MNFYYWVKNKVLGYSYKLENLEEVFAGDSKNIKLQIKEFGKYEDKTFIIKAAK